MAKKLALQDWVRSYGGYEKAAADMGVTTTAIRDWCRRYGWPKTHHALELVALSKGQLSLESILRSTCNEQQAPLVEKVLGELL